MTMGDAPTSKIQYTQLILFTLMTILCKVLCLNEDASQVNFTMRPLPMGRCLDEGLSILKTLATKGPNIGA